MQHTEVELGNPTLEMDKSENINNFHQLFGHVSQKRHIWLITIFSKAHQKKRSEQIDPVKTHNKPISQNNPQLEQ